MAGRSGIFERDRATLDQNTYSHRWGLTPDGDALTTPSSRLWPVRYRGKPAMLKIACEPEEIWGAGLMVWWEGEGSARVLKHDGPALLMERATGPRSLVEMVKQGEDDAASQIICNVVAKLHRHRDKPLPELVPLTEWFSSLFAMAAREGSIFTRCAKTAQALLSSQREIVALHGDIHHRNILDFGSDKGWLAIDPKRLGGERGFDYANLFCNPDHGFAASPGRLSRQLDVVAQASRLERIRLAQWVLAWAGLSASWFAEDGATEKAQSTLNIAKIAAAELE